MVVYPAYGYSPHYEYLWKQHVVQMIENISLEQAYVSK